MESGVRFACPSCNQALLAQQQAAETQGNCPFCGARFTVPALGSPQAPGAVASGVEPDQPATQGKGKEWGTAESRELWIGFAIGAGMALCFLLLLFPFQGTYFADLFLARGWVPYVLVLFLGWAAGILILKYRQLKVERRALLVDVLPLDISDTINPQNVEDFLRYQETLPKKLVRSYMLRRIRRGLEHFKARESNPEVASMMNTQSDIDAGKISGSYTLVKVFLWAIPIMGFIGTVLGISTAIAGLAGGMTGTAEMSALMDQLTDVTVGLGVAFDTTLVALCMSIVLSFPASGMQKAEEDLLTEVDEYCLENLLKRLSDAGGVSDVAGNTRALVNALAPALAENQQNFLKELRDVGQGMADGQARQLELVERTTAAIEAQRAVIEEKVGAMAENLETEAAHTLAKTSERVQSSFQVLADGMKELNKVLRDLDGKQIKIEKRRKWFW
jgi:hypothetical protein